MPPTAQFENLNELWSAALGELEVLISKANYSTWLKGSYLVSIDGPTANLAVSSHFIKNWLQNKFHKEIIATMRKLTDDAVSTVNYVIEINKPHLPELQLPAAAGAINSLNSPNQSCPLRLDYTFATFVVGTSNRLAYTTAQAVSETPGRRHNPLFLYGGVGLGKTHLLHAIGNHIAKTHPKLKIIYTPCEDFANEYINSLRHKTIDGFKKKYRGGDVFLVDDIQFLARKEGTQEEFFHTFNALQRKDAQIVMTADSLPRDIPHLEGRLTSRFGGGMIADIQAPNIETRQAILREKAAQHHWQIPDEVITFISTAVPSNIRELEGAFNRLMTQCEMLGVLPTIELARKNLADLVASISSSNLTPELVVSTICDYFKVDRAELISAKRRKVIVYPRQITMYLMRSELNMSFPEIGRAIGGKDHTTIMHGYSVIDSRNKRDESLRQEINEIKNILYN